MLLNSGRLFFFFLCYKYKHFLMGTDRRSTYSSPLSHQGKNAPDQCTIFSASVAFHHRFQRLRCRLGSLRISVPVGRTFVVETRLSCVAAGSRTRPSYTTLTSYGSTQLSDCVPRLPLLFSQAPEPTAHTDASLPNVPTSRGSTLHTSIVFFSGRAGTQNKVRHCSVSPAVFNAIATSFLHGIHSFVHISRPSFPCSRLVTHMLNIFPILPT